MSDKKTEISPGLVLLLVPLCILVGPFFALYWGWAASIAWAWFLVPLGAPALSAVQLGAVAYAVGLIEQSGSKSADWDDQIVRAILYPPLALLSAWLFKTWFM